MPKIDASVPEDTIVYPKNAPVPDEPAFAYNIEFGLLQLISK